MPKDQNEAGDVSDAELDAAAKGRNAARDARARATDAEHSRLRHYVAAKLNENAEVDTLAEFQSQKADDHFKIVIPSSGREDEVKRIYIGVNGVPYTILRDADVIVPKCVLQALDIAVETRYRDGKDTEGNPIKIPYKVRSYPYSVVDGPIPASEVAPVAA